MTANRSFKKKVRALMESEGITYTAALAKMRATPPPARSDRPAICLLLEDAARRAGCTDVSTAAGRVLFKDRTGRARFVNVATDMIREVDASGVPLPDVDPLPVVSDQVASFVIFLSRTTP